MSLSDIKFKYQSKIDNIHIRRNKYYEIIQDYTKQIKKAEKEENPNINSVISAKEQYESKLKNMAIVEKVYQEFVDTADYLMQNLNDKESFQLILKNEQLEEQNQLLLDENKRLESIIEDNKEELKLEKIKHDLDKSKLKESRQNRKDTIERITTKTNDKLLKLEKNNSSLKKDSKTLKKENKKLLIENQTLKDENEYLDNKVKTLEDYCNHLLSRKDDENLIIKETGKTIEIKSKKNIFEELLEEKV